MINQYWFPGRWIGVVSLLVAPILLLASEVMRFQFHFFFPDQLRAFRDHPKLVSASYHLFLTGNILLWPAVATVARLVGEKKSGWATWGGTLVIMGLFARTFHYGINHLTFQLVELEGLEKAMNVVAKSYGAFHMVSVLSSAILFGWIILAIGCYLSGVMKLFSAIALAAMSALMLGVLKGASWTSLVATSGLCIAFIPLGFELMQHGPKPSLKTLFVWISVAILLILAMYFLGQAG